MIKERTSSISALEKLFIKTGKIMAVRSWAGGGVHEIDVHLPHVDFAQWNTAQKIKCRITPLHFADYTPATWDAAEKRCTLFIDTSHRGQGSRRAQQQQAGNPFYYLHVESEHHQPVADKHHVFLGDQTAIGHFCALQQLAAAHTKIEGFITLNDLQTTTAFRENCPWLPLHTTLGQQEIYRQAEEWIQQQSAKDRYVFYIVGNAQLVVSLRKMLKQHGIGGNQIKSKGFWQ